MIRISNVFVWKPIYHIGSSSLIYIFLVFQHGETLLHVAASNGQLDVVKFLHDKGADLKVVDKVSYSEILSFYLNIILKVFCIVQDYEIYIG